MERVIYPLFPVLTDWRIGRQIITQFLSLLVLSINQQTAISGHILYSGMMSAKNVDPLYCQSWLLQFKTIYAAFEKLSAEKRYLGSVQEHVQYLVTFLSTVIYSYILKNIDTVTVREEDKVVLMDYEPHWMKRFVSSIQVNDQGQLEIQFRHYWEIQELAYGRKTIAGLVEYLSNNPLYRGRGRPPNEYVKIKYGVRQSQNQNWVLSVINLHWKSDFLRFVILFCYFYARVDFQIRRRGG